MKVALLQIASPDSEDKKDRILRVEQLIHSHKEADVLVLPELWSAGYFRFDEYAERSESLDGPTVSMCRRAASDIKAHIHLGSFIEQTLSGNLRNTSALIDPRGEIVHTYSKVHVFGYESQEAQLLTPGESISVKNSSIGRVTSTTCYDLRFPGLWSEISRHSPDLAFVPAAWPSARRGHWETLTTARALEHQIFILACNAAGEQRGVELAGHSRIVAPDGATLASAGPYEEVVTAELDVGDVGRVRAEFPVMSDRLSDYSRLTTEDTIMGPIS